MTESFKCWLAGFCDGEAHFTFSTRTSTSGRISASPRFNITLREDDRRVLEDACTLAGVGRVRSLSREYERRQGRHSRDAVAWEVTGPSCLVIVDILENRMLSKKALEFDVWATAIRKAYTTTKRHDPARAPILLEARTRLLELRQ